MRTLDTDQGAIVQDDVWLCENFRELVEVQTRACPDAVLCLFVSPQATQAAKELTKAIGSPVKIPRDHFLQTVAVVWPAGSALKVASFADGRRWSPTVADDAVTRRAVDALGLEVWACKPSLVEHIDDVPSLMGAGPGRRRRALFPHPSLAHLGESVSEVTRARKDALRGDSPRSRRRRSQASLHHVSDD